MGTDDEASSAVAPYRLLMQQLASGESEPEHFSNTYMDRYLADPTRWPEPLFDVLDRVFGMSESLVVDPQLRQDVRHAIAPDELVECVHEALRKLDELVPPGR